MLLLMRNGLSDVGPLRAGVAGLGETVVVAAAGLGVAAVVTPWLTARIGRPATVRTMLLLAALALLGLGLPMTLPSVLGASFLLGLVGQTIKLCSDAAVQREVDDAHRGRVFALSDTVFNVTYVLAVAAAALFSPLDGRSVPLIVTAAGIYLLGLVVHEIALRTGRHPGDTRGPDGGARPAPVAVPVQGRGAGDGAGPDGAGSRRHPARRALGHDQVHRAVAVDVGEQHVPARRARVGRGVGPVGGAGGASPAARRPPRRRRGRTRSRGSPGRGRRPRPRRRAPRRRRSRPRPGPSPPARGRR